jgi:hypothetical protein
LSDFAPVVAQLEDELTMISANDALQLISEVHQYSMLLLELKDATTLGIWHYPKDRASYFRSHSKLGRKERAELVQTISARKMSEQLVPLSVDEFLQGVEGKKARHIWLETLEPERRELAFLSIAELKTFLKSARNR